jgi:hypothetical protein
VSFTLSKDSGETGPTQWLIENRVLQFKFNLIFGRGEAGKSSIVGKIIGDWHNDTSLKGERKLNRVLWLTEEEGLTGKVKPRLFQYGLDDDQIYTINYHTGECPRPILPQDHDKFVKFLKENKINCIVIDPWTEVLNGDWSVFQPEQMRPYINGLNRVCFAARATIFGIGHVRKASGSHSSDDMLGCRQIMDSTRCVNRVDKTEDLHPCHFFTVQKCNDADPTYPMQFGFSPKVNGFSKVEWLGEKELTIADIKAMSESKVKRGKMEQAIRLLTEALATQEVSAKDLIEEAKSYGIGDRTLDDAKAQLNIKSERRIYADSGKAYWVWMMPKEAATNITTSGESDMPQLTLEDLPRADFEPEPEPTPEPAQGKYRRSCENKIGWGREPSICYNMVEGKGKFCHGCKSMLAHFKKVDKEAQAKKKPTKKRQDKTASV